MPSSKLSDPKLGNITDLPCPVCGDLLFEYSGVVWCSHVEHGYLGLSCNFGVAKEVTLEEYHRLMLPQPRSKPHGAGFYVFEGIRHSYSSKFIYDIRDLLEVRRKIVGKAITMMVYQMGIQRQYPLALYEGTWTRVNVRFGGKRVI